VVTGEFDQDICGPSNFDNEYMTWADAHGVGYLAWGWWVLTPQEIADAGCSAFYLLSDWSGTPAAPNGTNLHDHLLALAAGAKAGVPPAAGAGPGKPAPIKLTKFAAAVVRGGKVRFQITATASCTAKITGQTVKTFKVDGRKPHKVGLGTARAALTAGKPATVIVKLPAKALGLLKTEGSLRGRYTVGLSGGGGAGSSSHLLKLKPPKPKKH
jgi:hypothetical protein